MTSLPPAPIALDIPLSNPPAPCLRTLPILEPRLFIPVYIDATPFFSALNPLPAILSALEPNLAACVPILVPRFLIPLIILVIPPLNFEKRPFLPNSLPTSSTFLVTAPPFVNKPIKNLLALNKAVIVLSGLNSTNNAPSASAIGPEAANKSTRLLKLGSFKNAFNFAPKLSKYPKKS